MQKQARKAVADRRRALIEATILCLKSGGLENASVRRISTAAGISIGLINHYFSSKDDLIAEAYRHVAEQVLLCALQQASSSGTTPRAQLSGFFHGSFHTLDPDDLKVWIAFWSMTEQSPQVQAVHDKTNRDFRAHLETLLTQLCDDPEQAAFDVRLAAIGLSALIDGLWLELCLNPATCSPQEGVQLCEAWVNGLLNGLLPRIG